MTNQTEICRAINSHITHSIAICELYKGHDGSHFDGVFMLEWLNEEVNLNGNGI